MHAFIFTMFIIAIKRGHRIPEWLFGKESSCGFGVRWSGVVAEGRWDGAAGAGGCPYCCSGRTLLSAHGRGAEQSLLLLLPRLLWCQDATLRPGVMLVAARVGSLHISGNFG